MGGKSPVAASDEQRVALAALAGSRDRGEADRARAVLLTLAGWTSSRIAEAFSVREDTVRLWRSDFGRGGVDALKASIAPGPAPVKSETALLSCRISGSRALTLFFVELGAAMRDNRAVLPHYRPGFRHDRGFLLRQPA